EDLESLWKLVKERFEKTKPKNYTADYLLKNLKTMFEQPDVEASVWRDQKGRYELAKRYPLTHFTLEQMLNNVRLEVKEESEISLELLRLVRRQLNEGGELLRIMDFNILILLFILSAAAWNYCLPTKSNLPLSQSLLMTKVVEQMKGECEVLKEMEKSRDQECKELRIKYEAAMTDFDKNPDCYSSGKESTIASLEAEMVRLESVKASLRRELKNAKRDRAKVVSKVVPYVTTELVQSDDMGKLVAKLVNASIFYGRCYVFEEFAKMNEPFDITNVKGYRSYPYASVEVLLSKNPWILQHLAPTRTSKPTSFAPS
nr:hypothetical protein [Tanacetum cinerariifolium]